MTYIDIRVTQLRLLKVARLLGARTARQNEIQLERKHFGRLVCVLMGMPFLT